ncbi:protein-tyrosine phosphatase-like protein [Phycomyces blakesleeanus]|uniref:Protein-tyrosine phosphatase-like protein n=1 Tax=Phycomyces blakesleeanus TaxID=4837 RepID=A0ABR3B914_PHYBL
MQANTISLRQLWNLDNRHVVEHLKNLYRRIEHDQARRLAGKDGNKFLQTDATHSLARRKNRYSNIIPFNYNRVRLTYPGAKLDNTSSANISDNYINASMITDPFDPSRHYIATQGPLRQTIADFWQMVLDQNTRIIVCLTREMDSIQEKCARYWPLQEEVLLAQSGKDPNETMLNGDGRVIIQVRNIEPEVVEVNENRVVREIEVSAMLRGSDGQLETVKVRKVSHILYTAWPDHGVPTETGNIISLANFAESFQTPNAGPMVVHCSAGCGRTGAFCVISSVINATRQGLFTESLKEATFDPVFQLVDSFRRQRTTMVQTFVQFVFCYRAAFDIMGYADKNV